MSSGKKMRGLVVDDDPIIQQIHSLFLKKIGFETRIAKNGKEAVELYRSGASFQIIFMDMEMPIMDGPTATKELRGMGVDCMIVGVSSQGEDSMKNAFLAAGLDDFHTKPLTAAAVTVLLKKFKEIH